ncbi:hypothetical protein K488DRAFT_82182 [Vararia minispora EC-137]|uniref:Uncharacterized protein n=1 Tax=Vararia minispora EC-137 TaxID=1314806 RepID=A0ACB8QX34_9AGAM|nr:hypothetical protein K488DRAFT_82182 [Vararia minispora EC-137]
MSTEQDLFQITFTNLQYMAVGVIVNGILLGECAHTLLICLSSAIMLSKGLGTRSRAVQFAASLCTYTACVMYFGAYASPLLRQIFDPLKYTLVSGDSINALERVLTGAMAVAFWVGDAVVLWRTTVIWGPGRIVRAMSCLLYLNFVIVGAVDLATLQLYPPSSNPNYPSELPAFSEHWSWAALMSSFAINVYSLVLVTYKTWSHCKVWRTSNKTGLTTSATGTTQRLLMLLVGVSMTYVSVWIAYTVIAVLANDQPSLTPAFVALSGVLIEAAGIYPTLLIVVARLLNETIKKEQSYTSWGLQAAPSQNPIGIEFARTTNVSESGSAAAQSQHAITKYEAELRA